MLDLKSTRWWDTWCGPDVRKMVPVSGRSFIPWPTAFNDVVTASAYTETGKERVQIRPRKDELLICLSMYKPVMQGGDGFQGVTPIPK